MPAHQCPPRPLATRLRDRFVAADPGRFGFRASLRAGIGVLASAVLLLFITSRLGQPPTDALVGAAIAMMTSVAVTDPSSHDQRITLLMSIVASVVVMVIATFIAESVWLSGLLLSAVVFVAVAARSRGPRGMAVGMLAFMGAFYALFVQAKPNQLGSLVGSVLIGGAVSYVTRFWIVREDAQAVRLDVLRTFRIRLQLLLDDLADQTAAGATSERQWRRVRRATGGIDEVALAIEEALGGGAKETPLPHAQAWLAALLRTEVAVDLLVDALYTVATSDLAEERRAELACTARALERWVERGEDDARADALARLDAARAGEESESWTRLVDAVARFTSSRIWDALPPVDPARSTVSMMSFRPGGGGMAGVGGASVNLRLAVQATVAVALSIVSGRAISETRWYWAVIAAFVVFARASTVGETMSRAWQRLFGTMLGVGAGLALAWVIGQSKPIAIIVGLIALMVAYYMMRISYTAMIVCITAALALLYEMMGRPVPGLMELRLLETLTGAGIGVVASAVVLPIGSETRLRRLVVDLVRAAAKAIERATSYGTDPAGDLRLYDDVRAVDRALAEVRNAVRPFWGSNVPVEPSRLTGRGRTAAALAFATRRLATTPLDDGNGGHLVRQLGERLTANARETADALEEERTPSLRDVEPLFAQLAKGADHGEQRVTFELMHDLDATLRRVGAEGR